MPFGIYKMQDIEVEVHEHYTLILYEVTFVFFKHVCLFFTVFFKN